MLTAHQYRYREEYYRRVEQHQNEIRTIKHDLKNQLIANGAYLNSPEKERRRSSRTRLSTTFWTARNMTGLILVVEASFQEI